MSVLSARGLRQRLGRRDVLGPLDLELARGDRLAVIGDNGAGKTTLLRILATLARPNRGELRLFDTDVLGARDRIRPRLGYVGHQPGLYPTLTASENLRFFCALHGVAASRVDEVLELAGLESVANVRVSALSRGSQQRLALARAVLHDPELLILDEPDTSLDLGAAGLLQSLLQGRTAVVASHDRRLVTELCPRLLHLRAGRGAVDPPRLEVLPG